MKIQEDLGKDCRRYRLHKKTLINLPSDPYFLRRHNKNR